MAVYNKTIRGLSGAGFRVPNTGGTTYTKLTENTSATVDLNDLKTQLLLAGERDNFVTTQASGTFTVTIASPGVFTKSAHGFVNGDVLLFTTTGALPTGLVVGTPYFVISAATNTFQVSATFGGSAINTSVSQSGTHTVTPASVNIVGLTRYGIRLTDSNGVRKNVKLGSGVAQVDLTKGGARRVLRRSYGRYLVSNSASSASIYGIQAQQNGFDVGTPLYGKYTLTGSNSGNATTSSTVIVGGVTYTIKTNLTEAKATGTITDSSTGPANNDTVTIGSTVYTFKTALTGAAFEVLRTGVIDVALTNLASAITAGAGSGTTYGTGTTAHPTVTAGAVTAHVLTLTAKAVGTAGNIALSKSAANLSVSGAALTGGVNAVANEIKIAGTADLTLTNIVSAVNLAGTIGTDYSSTTVINPKVSASAVVAHVITFTSKDATGAAAASTTEATYTIANLNSTNTSTPLPVYRGVTAVVDPGDPFNYQALRRNFKSYVEA